MKERFLPEYRIKRGVDFERAYRRRRPASDDWLLIYVCENGLERPRLGASVSRKVGGAVVRNRWKRLLREAFRLQRERLPAGLDLVVIPRVPAPPPLAELQASLVRVAARAAKKLSSAAVNRFAHAAARLASRTVIRLVKLYQLFISPWIGPACRFKPTCSNYMIGAVRKYGVIKGVWRGLWRICRCHPFHPGGYDPP